MARGSFCKMESLKILFYLLTMSDFVYSAADSEVVYRKTGDGADQCSGDQPNEVVSARSRIECAKKCKERVGCVDFNFEKTGGRCELFFYIPFNFGKSEGCTNL